MPATATPRRTARETKDTGDLDPCAKLKGDYMYDQGPITKERHLGRWLAVHVREKAAFLDTASIIHRSVSHDEASLGLGGFYTRTRRVHSSAGAWPGAAGVISEIGVAVAPREER